jgi:hypothetical protein
MSSTPPYDRDDCGWSRCKKTSDIIFFGADKVEPIGLCSEHWEKLHAEGDRKNLRKWLIPKCNAAVKRMTSDVSTKR